MDMMDKVMIVDDMEVNRRILERIVSEMGNVPIVAESSKVALEQLQEDVPDLFLLDISMPGISGFELCKILKSEIRTRDIPVVFISAFSGTEEIVMGFDVGGVDYISKPFVPEEVSARIYNQIKSYHMQRELGTYNKRLNTLINEQINQIENERKNVLYAVATIHMKLNGREGSRIEHMKYNCRILAHSYQLSALAPEEVSNSFVDNVEIAVPMYNIGLLGISKDIQDKYRQGLLTSEEEIGHRALDR